MDFVVDKLHRILIAVMMPSPTSGRFVGPGTFSLTGQAAKVAGFSLHAGVMAEAHQRDKLERLCRYVSRPAVSEKRLVLTSNGQVR